MDDEKASTSILTHLSSSKSSLHHGMTEVRKEKMRKKKKEKRKERKEKDREKNKEIF